MSEGRRSKIVVRAEQRVKAREKREKIARFESCDWGKEIDCTEKTKKLKRQNSENYKDCKDCKNSNTCKNSKNCNSGKSATRGELPQEIPLSDKTESGSETEITFADIMRRKQIEKSEGIVY